MTPAINDLRKLPLFDIWRKKLAMPLPKRRGYRHYDTKSQTSILSFWSRSALLSLQESNYRHRRAEPKRLKFPCYLLSSARIFIFCGQRFSHAPHSLHKLAKWWLGRKAGRCIHILALPVFSGWRPHCMPQNKRGYPPHRGRACNNRKQCKESGRRNGTPGLPLDIQLVFPPR